MIAFTIRPDPMHVPEMMVISELIIYISRQIPQEVIIDPDQKLCGNYIVIVSPSL